MEYRALGTTGVEVSRVALGCGNFGGIGSAPAFFGQGESEEEEAVRAAASRSIAGGSVLLSPGCASLDMYESYVARGEDFARAVGELLKQPEEGSDGVA